jgi:glycosyltransferase involved in cell wall biosynthesis
MKTAACVVVRNEERILLEWIAYQFVVGFDTVVVFDNRSTDSTRKIADTASRHGDVRVFDWPFTYGRRQTDAFVIACKEFQSEFDWMALLDADEFLLPMQHASAPAFLAQEHFRTASAIAVTWAMFGSSGHEESPPGLVIENYCKRAWDNHGPNRHTKAIVRPSQVKAMPNPHYVEVSGRTVDVVGADVVWGERQGLLQQVVGLQMCRINHYFTRSRADWGRRLERGQVTKRTWDDFTAYDRNEIPDDLILRHLAPTKARMAALSGDAG